jgi:transposase
MADLARRRRQLIAAVVADKSRLDTSSPTIRKDIKSVVDVLERHIVKIDKQIDAGIAADPEKAANRERLQSAPSVGPGVARALIVDLPELGALSRREIASVVGLPPLRSR